MSLDVKKDPIEKQENQDNNTDTKLNTEFEKNYHNIADSMELMGKNEIDAMEFSDDERSNPQYMNKFTKLQDDFTAQSKKILSERWTPEEKIEALEFAFKKFEEEIWSIRGTKEGQDAQRATKQGENINKQEAREKQWSQKFKKALLKSIQEGAEKKIQAQKLMAETLSNTEQQNSVAQAKELQWPTGDVTLAFGPPGNSEKSLKA